MSIASNIDQYSDCEKYMNIIIVETPMELINAIEAANYFNCTDSTLYIHSFYDKNIFFTLLDRFGWRGERYFFLDDTIDWSKPSESYWRQFLRKRRIEKIIRHAGEANYLFIDYVRYHMRHVANNVKHNRLILLDGGTDALRVAAMRFQPMPESYSVKTLRSIIAEKLFGWNIKEIPSVTFYSSYDFEIRDGDYLIKNEYELTRAKLMNCAKSTIVYFLGQPLVEDGYVSNDTYLNYIEKFVTEYGHDDIVYVAHPRESSKSLNSYLKSKGITKCSFDYPVEIQMMMSGVFPRAVVSFFSSAIDNCRLIFGGTLDVLSIYINENDLLPGHEHVEDIYRYLKEKQNENFSVISFN